MLALGVLGADSARGSSGASSGPFVERRGMATAHACQFCQLAFGACAATGKQLQRRRRRTATTLVGAGDASVAGHGG